MTDDDARFAICESFVNRNKRASLCSSDDVALIARSKYDDDDDDEGAAGKGRFSRKLKFVSPTGRGRFSLKLKLVAW